MARIKPPTNLPTYPRSQWRSTYFVPRNNFIKYYIFGDILLKCSDPLRYHCAKITMYCGNTLAHAHTYIHTRLAYVRMYNSCTRVYAADGRAADAMKKRFSSLTVSSYHCLPTFFSLSPYNISSPAG